MVASVICFSIMDICVKWLNYYPVGQVLFFRFFIGFIPIFFIIPKDKILNFYKTSRPGLHAFRAVSGALAIIALFYGLRELPLADVVSLTFGGPIFVTIASIFFLSEKVRIKRWFAVFFGFIGMLLIVQPAFTDLNYYYIYKSFGLAKPPLPTTSSVAFSSLASPPLRIGFFPAVNVYKKRRRSSVVEKLREVSDIVWVSFQAVIIEYTLKKE
jgi:drug/metabolite transporter (DMT)-like permease